MYVLKHMTREHTFNLVLLYEGADSPYNPVHMRGSSGGHGVSKLIHMVPRKSTVFLYGVRKKLG